MKIKNNFGLISLNEIDFNKIEVIKAGLNSEHSKILVQARFGEKIINYLSIDNLNLIPYYKSEIKSFESLCNEHDIVTFIQLTPDQFRKALKNYRKVNYASKKHGKIIKKMCREEDINFVQATSLLNIMLRELVNFS